MTEDLKVLEISGKKATRQKRRGETGQFRENLKEGSKKALFEKGGFGWQDFL